MHDLTLELRLQWWWLTKMQFRRGAVARVVPMSLGETPIGSEYPQSPGSSKGSRPIPLALESANMFTERKSHCFLKARATSTKAMPGHKRTVCSSSQKPGLSTGALPALLCFFLSCARVRAGSLVPNAASPKYFHVSI